MDLKIHPLDPASMKQPPVDDFGFGNLFSNRMFTQQFTTGQGWQDAKIGPYEPIALWPSTAVFHYAQEIFEGTKAYRRADGNVNLFRPGKTPAASTNRRGAWSCRPWTKKTTWRPS